MWTIDDRLKEVKSTPIRELATTVIGRAAISCETQIQGLDADREKEDQQGSTPANEADQQESEGASFSMITSSLAALQPLPITHITLLSESSK